MSHTLHTEDAACALTVTATQSANETLRLEYSILNRTAEPLYLCNLFWRDSRVNPTTRKEEFEVSRNDAYLKIENNHLRVALSTISAAISDGTGIRFTPLLTRVEPGQQFTSSLALPLPLVPYLKADNVAPAGVPISMSLYFEVGYFLGNFTTEKQISPVTTAEGTAYQIAPFLASNQQLIAAGPFGEPVAVAPWLGKDITRPWD